MGFSKVISDNQVVTRPDPSNYFTISKIGMGLIMACTARYFLASTTVQSMLLRFIDMKNRDVREYRSSISFPVLLGVEGWTDEIG